MPDAKTGNIPAATQALTTWRYQVLVPLGSLHELLTTCGRSSGLGSWPERSVGASIHWPDDSSACSEQSSASQPFAAIHVAPGATPMPSAPVIVPVTCVPW